MFLLLWGAQKAGAASELTWDGDGTGEGKSPWVLGWMSWSCPRSPSGPACFGWVLSTQHREARSLFALAAPGLQFTKGSDASEGSRWAGTEDEPLCHLPAGSALGQPGALRSAAWPGNCLWCAPGLALPRRKLLAVNSVNSPCQLQITVFPLRRYPYPPPRGRSNFADGKVVCLWKQMNVENPERERWEPRGYFEEWLPSPSLWFYSLLDPVVIFLFLLYFFYSNNSSTSNSVLMVKPMIITVNAGSVFLPKGAWVTLRKSHEIYCSFSTCTVQEVLTVLNSLRVPCLGQSASYKEKHHCTFVHGRPIWSALKLLPQLKKKIETVAAVAKHLARDVWVFVEFVNIG